MRHRLAIAMVLCAFLPGARSHTSEAAACHQALTFRWTSGEPLRLGVVHPPPEAVRNPPFLIDPFIASAAVGEGRFGPNLTIKLGPDAAAVLTRETAAHHHAQLLVMLGGDVLIAAIAMGPFGADVVLDGHPADELARLAKRLRGGSTSGDNCLTTAARPASGRGPDASDHPASVQTSGVIPERHSRIRNRGVASIAEAPRFRISASAPSGMRALFEGS